MCSESCFNFLQRFDICQALIVVIAILGFNRALLNIEDVSKAETTICLVNNVRARLVDIRNVYRSVRLTDKS